MATEKQNKEGRPGFFFCICPDSELIQKKIDQILSRQPDVWKQKVFWADEEIPEAYWESYNQSGLWGQGYALILRRADSLNQEFWNKLHQVLKRFRQGIWPFFCLEKGWSRGKPQLPTALIKQKYWVLAKKRGWIWQYPGLSLNNLPNYLNSWAKSKNISLSREFLSKAQQCLPLDAACLNNELEKLELYVGPGGEISEDCLEVLSYQPEIDVFGLLRAIQSKGQEIKVWRQVIRQKMHSDSSKVMPFLGLLAREARILWMLASGEENKVSLYPQIKREKKQLAARIGLFRLAEIWTLLIQAETEIKSGQCTPEQAFESLLTGLMQVFGPGAGGKR